jgi:hypothetical protein
MVPDPDREGRPKRMTEIREPHYTIDLPGEWEQAVSLDDEAVVYHDTASSEAVSVTLLGVDPAHTGDDPKVLLDQYIEHRVQTEKAGSPALEQSPPLAQHAPGRSEGAWNAFDPTTDRRIAHRVILVGAVLADFRFTASGMPPAPFFIRAMNVLATATAKP